MVRCLPPGERGQSPEVSSGRAATNVNVEDKCPGNRRNMDHTLAGGNRGRPRDNYPSMDSDDPPHLRLVTADDVSGVPARRPAHSHLRSVTAVVGLGQVVLGLHLLTLMTLGDVLSGRG